jgi:hypothetical protein
MTNVIELAVVTGTTLAFPNPSKLHNRGERVRAKAIFVVMAKKKTTNLAVTTLATCLKVLGIEHSTSSMRHSKVDRSR